MTRINFCKMGCKISTSSPPILTSFPSKKLQFQTRTISFSPFSNLNEKSPTFSTITTQIHQPKADTYTVNFKTLGGCKLGISRYPDFEYNAQGGGGEGKNVTITDSEDREILVNFGTSTLYIPPVTSATTKFLGLPLPPFLKIDIVPELFCGSINPDSGKVELEFKAKFLFSVGSVYRAPPLVVETVLTSEESKGEIRSGRGERMNSEGKCRLVGVAIVQPIQDILMNFFLGLPTECLANLNAVISISS